MREIKEAMIKVLRDEGFPRHFIERYDDETTYAIEVQDSETVKATGHAEDLNGCSLEDLSLVNLARLIEEGIPGSLYDDWDQDGDTISLDDLAEEERGEDFIDYYDEHRELDFS